MRDVVLLLHESDGRNVFEYNILNPYLSYVK